MTTVSNNFSLAVQNAQCLTEVPKASNSAPMFENFGKTEDKTQRVNEAKQELMNRIYSRLDLDPADKSFKVEIINENGKYFVKLTRLVKGGTNYKLGEIKDKLNIADGVISENNDLQDVTGRPNLYKSDSATLEEKKFIKIPLEEVGTTIHLHVSSWFPGKLRDAVQQFSEVTK